MRRDRRTGCSGDGCYDCKEVGTIDILVNNAGIIRRVPMHEMDAADFRRVIDIDLNAPFIVAKAVLPAMMENVQVRSSTSVL